VNSCEGWPEAVVMLGFISMVAFWMYLMYQSEHKEDE
jgi:uncharacterized membrane protein